MSDVNKPKRGRKPKQITDENIVKPEPKKRGRKPKSVTNETITNEPKKRGRKPKEKIYGKQSDNIDSVFVNDNVIIHLNVDNTSDKSECSDYNSEISGNYSNSNTFENNILTYNPEITNPINSDTIGLNNNNTLLGNIDNNDDLLSFGPTKNDYVNYPFTDDITNNSTDNIKDNDSKKKKNNFLMKSFYKTKDSGWLTSTDISCFWCCHNFQCTPCALPIRYKNDSFEVIGCFCQPECAAAYNFNETINIGNAWERYALLNLMYKQIYKQNIKIKLAPSKLLLTKFGGHLTIKEFRDLCSDYNKTYQVIDPPMISILSMREEIMLNRNNNIKNKVASNAVLSEEHYKLKRSKPLKDKKNTLDDCMNLKIN